MNALSLSSTGPPLQAGMQAARAEEGNVSVRRAVQ
jgi:hypothetical protein